MRFALWLMALFSLAVAGAWLADHNSGSVSLFVHTYRVDVSLNLFVLCVLLLVWVLWLTLRALTLLWSLPREARRWRTLQKERATHAALLTAQALFMSGRYVRAIKSANAALQHEAALRSAAPDAGVQMPLLRTLAHLVAAESAHALQDRAQRQTHWQAAQHEASLSVAGADRTGLPEGLLLRAARWQLDDRQAPACLQLLEQLPQAAARRTLALRMALKASRLAGLSERALDAAMLLAKHRAFSPSAGRSLVRSLALDVLARTHDHTGLLATWRKLPPALHAQPEVAMRAAQRWLQMGAAPTQARQWLKPVWTQVFAASTDAALGQKYALIEVLERSLQDVTAPDARQWLADIEAQQQAQPRDAHLQYLTGMVCVRHQLWGKAQQLLRLATQGRLSDPRLVRRAWIAIAHMAQAQGDASQAAHAWQRAACADASDAP